MRHLKQPPQSLVSIGRFLPSLNTQVLKKRGIEQGRLMLEWEYIVGPTLAALSSPEKLVFPYKEANRSQGCLFLKVTSSAALEIQHQSIGLIERINQYFGFALVERLHLQHGYRPPSYRPKAPSLLLENEEKERITAELQEIEDEELKNTLHRFGEALLSHIKNKHASAAKIK